MLHLKLLEKQEQAKPKARRRREIKTIRSQSTKQRPKKRKKQESIVLEKIHKINKLLKNLIKEGKETN
jgi:hypothetical protein